MIGFDAIGRSAIGELAGGDDVVIFAPAALDVSGASPSAPEVHGGGSALPPGTTIAVTVAIPLVAVGAVVSPPVTSIVVARAAPFITQSATIAAPANDVAATATPPTVLGGASVSASSAVTVTAPAAIILAGVRIEAPFIGISVVSSSVMVSGGTIVMVPAATVAATSAPIDILGGNYIEASNTVTMITPYGEIGSASIGEFAIGEGEPSTRIVRRGILIRVDVDPPSVFAGKAVFSPVANIDTRLRRIRVHAIAS